MTDPTVISSVITGLVGAVSAYMTYRVGMANVQKEAHSKEAHPVPEQSKAAMHGEAVAQVIETGITKYGNDAERTALVGYKQSPQLFEAALVQVLTTLAARAPEFAAQLRALAQQEGLESSNRQTAIGTNIAQADRGSSAKVSVNEPRRRAKE